MCKLPQEFAHYSTGAFGLPSCFHEIHECAGDPKGSSCSDLPFCVFSIWDQAISLHVQELCSSGVWTEVPVSY